MGEFLESQEMQRLETLLAHTNLVPTAEEFVPRSSQSHLPFNNTPSTSNTRQHTTREFFSRNREPKYDREPRENTNGRWKRTEVFRMSNGQWRNDNKGFKNKKKDNIFQPHREDFEDRQKFQRQFNNKNQNVFKSWRSVNAGPTVKNDANQMDTLILQLTKGILECLVCCDYVKQTHSTWSCGVCHHVLHLRCIEKWAKTSSDEGPWRCPACNQPNEGTPTSYVCFCGKTLDPMWNRVDCPHTCGQVCGLPRSKNCPHPCTLLCHPGPCPPCGTHVRMFCNCGKTSDMVLCPARISCKEICQKTLNCGKHQCEWLCHEGPCYECKEVFIQGCYCGSMNKEMLCHEPAKGFSCEKACDRKLSCNNHDCPLKCHPGECPECPLTPSLVISCPCGKTDLTDEQRGQRKTCFDPIPSCGKVCNKRLKCGDPHLCKAICHESDCPPCPLQSNQRCRCGNMNEVVPCMELLDDVRCRKRCNKKRSCGKHKCPNVCCIDVDHTCPQPCHRMLPCNRHRCEALCHNGYCRPCSIVSFDELRCECGAEVVLPPVACGTKPPVCQRPCSRNHACGHEPTHFCHSMSECPPCTVLVSRHCHGEHELRRAVPCHQNAFSCGLPCGRPLSCGRHTCPHPCHPASECTGAVVENTCTQPCTTSRPVCGHPCGAACHEGQCPDIPCKMMVRVTCECGNRTASRSCEENAREFQRISIAQIASKITDVTSGQTVDLRSVNKKISFKTLDCNEECMIIARNLRLTMALQIRNPDLSAKLTPRYSDLLRNVAKKDPAFCQMVHEKLTQLVQLAKQSKQKSRSYSFDPMNKEKRQFIHEYCEHFGCESVAYDPEPKRNIVATALKDKSWLPGLSLLEVIQRESGARKVPVPTINTKLQPTPKSMEVLTSKSLSNGESSSNDRTVQPSTSASSAEPRIDYFDLP